MPRHYVRFAGHGAGETNAMYEVQAGGALLQQCFCSTLINEELESLQFYRSNGTEAK